MEIKPVDKVIEFENNEISYFITGSGTKTVVFLHGFLENKEMWNFIIPDLVSDYKVIAIDLPGHGESDINDKVHSMNLMASTVEKILKVEKIDSAKFVCHSMGGYVALALGDQDDHDLIESLCLFHSTTRGDSDGKKEERKRLIKVVEKNKETFIQLSIPNLFAPFHRNELKNKIDLTIKEALKTPVEGIVQSTIGMMNRKHFDSRLNHFYFDIHFIIGDRDPVVPFDYYIDQLKHENVTYDIMEGIGHMSHIEAPEEAKKLILSFLNEKRR